MRLGDTEKAKVAFKTELASNANDFDSNLYLGVLLRQDKQTDEARQSICGARFNCGRENNTLVITWPRFMQQPANRLTRCHCSKVF